MLFTDLKKDQLVEAANFYKVDFSPSDTKEEISLALLDAGKTPEGWEKDRNEFLYGDTGSDDEPAEEEAEEEPAAEEEPVKEEMVLVRFTGANRSYRVGRHVFTALKPFALMTAAEFDKLDRSKFREASKREAAEFYGR